MPKKPCVIEIAYSSRPAKTSKGRQNLITKRFPKPVRFKRWLAGLAKEGNTGEKNGPFIISGPTLDPNNHSHAKSNIGKLTIIGYESDTKEDDPGPTLEKVIRTLDKVGLDSIGYTTFSHGLPGRGNRWRVFVFLSRPIKEPEQVALHDYLRDLLHTNGCEVKDSKDTRAYARVWYLPNAPLDMPVPTVMHGKASGAIDVDAAVAYHEENYGVIEPRHRKQRINWRNKIHVNGYDSAIDWVNDSMDLRDVLAEHGYEYVSGSYDPREKAYTERWSCPRAQSTAGVIVFVDDDYLRVMSHHAENDPLWNPSLAVHDTFGVIQTLDFDGDMDEALSWARDQKFAASLDEDDGKSVAKEPDDDKETSSLKEEIYGLVERMPHVLQSIFNQAMSTAKYPKLMWAFFVTLAIGNAIVNRRAHLRGDYPVLFYIFLGGFARGKNQVVRMAQKYASLGMAHVVQKIASAEGLENKVLDHQVVVSVWDEYKNDTERGILIADTENVLFNCERYERRITVTSKENHKAVDIPFYMRIATTTPESLFTGKNSFESVMSGHAARSLFIVDDDEKLVHNQDYNKIVILDEVEQWAWDLWYKEKKEDITKQAEQIEKEKDDPAKSFYPDYVPWELHLSKEAEAINLKNIHETDDLRNSLDKGDKATDVCLGRRAQHAMAFYMIFSLADDPLSDEIDAKWVELAWDITKLYSKKAIPFLSGHVHETLYSKQAALVMETGKSILAKYRAGDKLSQKVMVYEKFLKRGKVPQRAILQVVNNNRVVIPQDAMDKLRDSLHESGHIKVEINKDELGKDKKEKHGRQSYVWVFT